MPEVPPFSPTVALLTLTATWEAEVAAALKPLGLTTRKYGLLGHIRSSPGISFSELARRSRITAPSAHGIVSAFEVEGLVADETARAGAASHLRVTAAGEDVLARAAARIGELDARLEAAHPGIVDALRAHLEEVMGGRSTFR